MDYKRKFVNGAKLNSIRMLTITLVQFLTTVIVGKYLLPAEYGLFGMVNVFIGFAWVLSDAGLSNVIIYKQEEDKNVISSLFWMNFIIGILVCILMILFAPLASYYYREPKLIKLIALSSINFIILPFGQIFMALCKKNLQFGSICIIDSLSNIIQLVATLIMAIRGYGVLSLIYGKIIQSIIGSAGYMIVSRKKYKINLHFNYNEINDFISFGLYELGGRFTNYFRANIDYILIGMFLGPKQLGIYTLAYNLVMMPILKINPILTDTSYPIFVKFKNNNEKLNISYYKLIKTIALLTFPIIAGLFIVTPEVINTFYGANWTESIIIIRIYCIVAIIISLNNPINCLLYPKGRFDIGFKWNIISAFCTLIFNLIGLRWGIIGVTISSTIYALLIAWPADFVIRRIVSEMRVKHYFYNLHKPTIIIGIMFLVLYLVKGLIRLVILNNSIDLLLLVSIGACIYIYLIKVFENDIYIMIKNKITSQNV